MRGNGFDADQTQPGKDTGTCMNLLAYFLMQIKFKDCFSTHNSIVPDLSDPVGLAASSRAFITPGVTTSARPLAGRFFGVQFAL
jgi:hypothetical protein